MTDNDQLKTSRPPLICQADVRALRYMRDEGAHEIVQAPLTTLQNLMARGLAKIGFEYQTPRHGKARIIVLSEAGEKALKLWEAEDAR